MCILAYKRSLDIKNAHLTIDFHHLKLNRHEKKNKNPDLLISNNGSFFTAY
jgi:hypothetical protein